MKRQTAEYTIANAVTPKAVTSSTDASPVVVTSTSHGLSTGDMVLIAGHATNLAANGMYRVTRLTADTFSLQDRNTGANVDGSGAGAGSGGILIPAPKVMSSLDFRNCTLYVSTSGTATLNLKVAISNGRLLEDQTPHGDTPNFGAAQSKLNPYTFSNVVDLEDGNTVEGDAGIAVTGTDISSSFEINTNLQKYVCIYPTSWTQGSYSVKAILSTEAA